LKHENFIHRGSKIIYTIILLLLFYSSGQAQSNEIICKGRITKKPLFFSNHCGFIISCQVFRFKVIESNIDSLIGKKIEVAICCPSLKDKILNLRYFKKINLTLDYNNAGIIRPKWSKYQNKNIYYIKEIN